MRRTCYLLCMYFVMYWYFWFIGIFFLNASTRLSYDNELFFNGFFPVSFLQSLIFFKCPDTLSLNYYTILLLKALTLLDFSLLWEKKLIILFCQQKIAYINAKFQGRNNFTVLLAAEVQHYCVTICLVTRGFKNNWNMYVL